jgi:hypothetical protein
MLKLICGGVALAALAAGYGLLFWLLLGAAYAQSVLIVGGTHTGAAFPSSVFAPTGMTCDADGDNRVTIDELLAGVANALNPLASCGFGCDGPCLRPIPTDPPCPCNFAEQCVEPGVIEGELRCGVSICYRSPAQYDACVRGFARAYPDQCEVIP